jgi:hypothetical protein
MVRPILLTFKRGSRMAPCRFNVAPSTAKGPRRKTNLPMLHRMARERRANSVGAGLKPAPSFSPYGRGGVETRPYAFRRQTSFTFLSGRLRTGLPVAAWMALRTAGVTTEMVGSPMPPQKS